MDIVTLGVALNGSAEYVNSHFKGGSNIQIVDNPDGTQTINASGEVSSEDTVARNEIAAIKDGETLDSFGDVETALAGKVDTVSGKGLSSNDFTNTLKTKLDNIESGAEVNVQSDWNQTTNTADDFIKNKPILGTAAAKDVPISGNATSSQVVLGDDTRLTDARNASDVYSWAKASEKPSYTASEVGALADTVKYAGASSAGGSATSAVKLDNAADAGSLTQPIFFESGKPKATTYSLGKSVPSNAVFTDTTYVFEGTYNASTNKAATMADIKDGVLTGYAQSSGNISATDKVVEAFGKVEAKVDTDTAALIELVDGGAKNQLTESNFTGTAQAEIPIRIPAGTYVIYRGNLTSDDTDYTSCLCRFYDDSGGTNVQRASVGLARGEAKSTVITVSGNTTFMRIYASDSSAHSTGDTVTGTNFMVCTKAAWDISQTYQPYRPSYQELYDRVVALEQANQ